MGKVAIVTDSGADLPESFQPKQGLHIVPLSVHIDNVDYKDGIDLTREEFRRRLPTAQKIHTAQPSPCDFVKAYQETDYADKVLCLTLSSRLSGTCQSAVMASDMVDNDVVVFDTLSASVGMGLMVMRAVEMANAGATRHEILRQLQQIRDTMRIALLVDTLEYLERNGRIGKAASMLGTVLKIKPVLQIVDGTVAPLDRTRGKTKALQRIVRYFGEEANNNAVTASIAHLEGLDVAAELKAGLAETGVPISQLTISEIGPTIGVHTGPGVAGVAFYPTID